MRSYPALFDAYATNDDEKPEKCGSAEDDPQPGSVSILWTFFIMIVPRKAIIYLDSSESLSAIIVIIGVASNTIFVYHIAESIVVRT